jgi:hypothetical protein
MAWKGANDFLSSPVGHAVEGIAAVGYGGGKLGKFINKAADTSGFRSQMQEGIDVLKQHVGTNAQREARLGQVWEAKQGIPPVSGPVNPASISTAGAGGSPMTVPQSASGIPQAAQTAAQTATQTAAPAVEQSAAKGLGARFLSGLGSAAATAGQMAGPAQMLLTPYQMAAYEQEKIRQNPHAPEYANNPYAMHIRGHNLTQAAAGALNQRSALANQQYGGLTPQEKQALDIDRLDMVMRMQAAKRVLGHQ